MSFSKYASYTESDLTWIAQYPSHWALVPLKRIGSIRYGIGEPPRYHDTGTPLIRATNVHVGKVLREGLVFVDPADIPEHRIVWLAEGDIIVVRSGAYTGDSALITEEMSECIAGFDMVLRCHSASPEFVQYALLSKYLKEGQLDLLRMRAAQPHLNAEELGSCALVLPPDHEQEAIATFLDRETAKIDALISAQQRLMELLQEKRQAVISHAVTKGLNPDAPMKPSGVEWLGEVPAHWDVIPLKRDLEFVTSGSRGWAEHYKEEGDLFIRIANLTRDSIRLDLADAQHVVIPDGAEGSRTRVRAGDVLFSITAYLGSVAIVPALLEPAYVSQHVALARVLRVRLLPEWVGYVALSDIGQSWFKLQSYGGTKIQLSLDDIRNLPIPVPPTEEQRGILLELEQELSRLAKLADESAKLVALLQERRKSLISAAVTGQIDVRAANEVQAA